MTNVESDDYHDFVISNGKLVAEFEQMYQKSKDIPWHQDAQDDWLDIRLTFELLKEFGKFDNITDFGCGLGYFLNLLRGACGKDDCAAVGYDISTTCCARAARNFPEIEFHSIDLMDENLPQTNIPVGKNLFSLRGTLWYVFPKIKTVISNISYMTKKDDLLLISQNFPPLDTQFVGKETIPNPQAIIGLFSEGFSPLQTMFLEDWVSNTNNNWFVGVFRKT